MTKIILSGKEAKSKMLKGVTDTVDIVKITMGPAGRNVLLNNVMTQKITKDGVSVAKEIKFDDPVMEAGARLVKEAAQKTCDESGDATTLTSVLIEAIINSANKHCHDIKPIELKRILDRNCKIVTDYLKDISINCVDDDIMLRNVAYISTNSDKELSRLVFDAIKKATKDGAVGIESSMTDKSYVDTVTGMRFERGYESQYFQNDENGKVCMFESPNIIIYRGKIDNIPSLVKILEPSINIGRPVVIIADDYSEDIINALTINKVQNGFKLCAIKTPSFKAQREAMVSDLEILLGCHAINTPKWPIDKFDVNIHLGSCDKIVIDRHYTTITGGDGSETALNTRIEEIRRAIDNSDNKDEIARLKERLVKLSGGVSIIYIGSDSETETAEIKDRADDAVCAVRSAMQEGIVPGGGAALFSATNLFEKEDNNIRNMMFDILIAPMKQIADNAYMTDEEFQSCVKYIQNAYKKDKVICGISYHDKLPYTRIMNNMIEAGVVDPTKSIRTAFENAVSVASMLLTTEACVIEDFNK